MSVSPLVSIVIPNYNHEKYLGKRIESVLNQTFQNFEVILLDDCSTDDSFSLLKELEDHPKVTHLIINEANSGSPFKQWSKGIALAKGQYVWIAESDDWAEKTFLEESVRIISRDKKIGVVSHKSFIVNENDDIIGSTDYQFSTLILHRKDLACRYEGLSFLKDNMLFRSGIYNVSGVLFRKEACTGFSDYTELKQAGDTLFWTNILLDHDIVVNYQKLNYFRQHQNSTTYKNFQQNIYPMLEMYKRIGFVKKKIDLNNKEWEYVYKKAFERSLQHIRNLGWNLISADAFAFLNKARIVDSIIASRYLNHLLKLIKNQISIMFKSVISLLKKGLSKIFHAELTERIFQKGFGIIGYEIHVRSKQSTEDSGQLTMVSQTELDELQSELELFSRLHPNCIGKEVRGDVNWSDPFVVREYLQDWRIALFHDVVSLIQKLNIDVDDKKVVDVGSGTGYLIRLIQKHFTPKSVTGYDTYVELNQLAQFLCPGAIFLNKDLFSEFDETYDLMICMETLEHLKHPELAIKNMLKYLNKTGKLILTVPDGRRDTFEALGLFPNRKGYWGHINFWSIESWEIFIKKSIPKSFEVKTGKLGNGRILYAVINISE